FLFPPTLLPPPCSTLFPYTTLFRSHRERVAGFRFLAPRRGRAERIGDRRRLSLRGTTTLRLRIEDCGLRIEDLNQINPQSAIRRSEEHTSELQSRSDLVCRLLLEKK